MRRLSFKLILVLVSALFMWSCEDPVSASNFGRDIEELVLADSIDFLALGDSYTVGQSVADTEDRWPNQLVRSLENDGLPVREFRIVAMTGWTTTNLLNAMEVADLKQYNLVSLLIGVNNQFQGKPFDLFEREFAILLDQSIELAGGKENVFVVSIPDYGVTPFGLSNSYSIAMEINKYNAHIEEQCMELGIPFIDVTSISRRLGYSPGALASDNLHPSGEQYSQWVDVIYPVVRNMLNK